MAHPAAAWPVLEQIPNGAQRIEVLDENFEAQIQTIRSARWWSRCWRM